MSNTVYVGLDHHAYRGAPRRIGSNWSGIEANPPSEHGWAEYNKQRNWNWRPQRKHAKRQTLTPKQQAAKLLAKLLGQSK